MKKLTLSANEKTVKQAKRLAARQKTSVSRMFARLVRNMAEPGKAASDVPADSIASRATGFISLPKGKSPRDVLAEALMEKHGIRR